MYFYDLYFDVIGYIPDENVGNEEYNIFRANV